MKFRKVAAILSILLVVLSILAIAVRGLNFGLDFTGGTVIEYAFEKPVELAKLRTAVEEKGYEASVVSYGSDRDVLLRLQTEDKNVGEKLHAVLSSTENPATLKRAEFVGPQVGQELKDQGGLALLFALFVVMFYVAFRFQYKFAVGSVVALLHDVVIVIGLFAMFQWEFDLTVLAAILAIIGYSLNDTIVVFDRIRENFLEGRGDKTPLKVIDVSISQTLDRTIVTSLTTFFVVLVLFFFGGEIIKGFSKALIVGILIGTYSSVFVAANMLLAMKSQR
ncbi:MAG: protein translocase subunit SecF, partial [Pseudomonadota bacterium]